MKIVSELRKKSTPIYFKGSEVKTDKTTGTIKGIVIGQEGFDKYDEYWDQVFLEQLITAGNAMPKGLKSRFGHPNMCDTTLGSYIGRFKDFSLSKNSIGKNVVVADLYLDPICKNAPGGRGNLYDYVLGMAEHNDDMFGNSIAFYENEPEKVSINFGEEVRDVYALRLKLFDASDLVDSPAATDSLFKDIAADDLGITVTNFIEENPRVMEILTSAKGKDIVDNFLTKLKSYQTQKMKKENTPVSEAKKTWLQKMKEAFGTDAPASVTFKAFDLELLDGSKVTVSDEDGNGTAAVGDKVTNADGSPVASSTVEGKNGTKITTDANGVVTAVEGESIQPAATVEAQKEVSTLKEKVAELTTKLQASEKEKEDMLALTQKEVATIKEQLAKVTGTHVVKESQTTVSSSATEQPVKNRVEEAYAKKKEAAAAAAKK